MKSWSQRVLVTSIITSLAFTAGCSYRRDKQSASTRPGEASKPQSAWFQSLNAEIIAPRCLTCHSPGDKSPDLSSYQKVFANIRSFEHQVIVAKTMPKSAPLPADEMARIKEWIDAGAPEFSSTPVEPEPQSPPPTGTQRSPVTWKDVSEKLISKHCAGCHFTGNEEGLASYSEVDEVKSTIGTIYFAAVVTSTMPPPPKDWPEDQPNPRALSQEMKDLLGHWISDGMPGSNSNTAGATSNDPLESNKETKE